MTRLSSRLTVSALALVVVTAAFGLGSPRPRAAVRDRVARTVVRVGLQRATGQAGGALSGEDHQAEHLDAVVAAADQAGPAGSAPDAGLASAHAVLLDDAPDGRPVVVAAIRLPVDADLVPSRAGVAPSPGRAPPAA